MDDASETPLEKLHSPFGSNKPFVCEGMPQWMRDSVEHSAKAFDPHNDMEGTSFDECPPQREDSVGGLLTLHSPHYRDAALPIERVTAPLTAREFYRRFARPGLPFILAGVLGQDVTAAKAAAVGDCCRDDYERKRDAHRNVSDAGCDRYNGWCREGVQICAATCMALAGFARAADVPTALRTLLDFPPPLPGFRDVASRFSAPFTLWTAPADTFGGNTHFDELCGSTLSLQYQGRKRWTLWAPWDVGAPVAPEEGGGAEHAGGGSGGAEHAGGGSGGGDQAGSSTPAGRSSTSIPTSVTAAHTRFEGVVGPGEALFYPPAWFHATVVVDGNDSLTGAFDVDLIPSFGELRGRSLEPSPLGFHECAAGEMGWYARSRVWDRMLAVNGRSGGGAAPPAPHGDEL